MAKYTLYIYYSIVYCTINLKISCVNEKLNAIYFSSLLIYLRIVVSIRVVYSLDDLPPPVLVQCVFYESIEIRCRVI